MNKLFTKDKLIFCFGGGDVVDSEHAVGFSDNTRIFTYPITRTTKNGIEISHFTENPDTLIS